MTVLKSETLRIAQMFRHVSLHAGRRRLGTAYAVRARVAKLTELGHVQVLAPWPARPRDVPQPARLHHLCHGVGAIGRRDSLIAQPGGGWATHAGGVPISSRR